MKPLNYIATDGLHGMQKTHAALSGLHGQVVIMCSCEMQNPQFSTNHPHQMRRCNQRRSRGAPDGSSTALHISNQVVVKNNFLCGIYVVKPKFELHINSSSRSSAKRSISLSANSFKLLSALFGGIDLENQ